MKLFYYFTVSPCFQCILYRLFKFCGALRAFTNTIFYCFTLFWVHSLLSFQILRRASLRAHLLIQYSTVSPCFHRILYRHSKFWGALCAHLLTQHFTVSPCFQHILYRHSKFWCARGSRFKFQGNNHDFHTQELGLRQKYVQEWWWRNLLFFNEQPSIPL